MSPNRLFLALFVLLAAAYPQTLADTTTRELNGKTVLLRGFPRGNKLKYTSAGDPVDLKAGLWTVDGYLRVERVELKDRELRIHGKRLAAIYDPKSRAMELKSYEDKVELRIPTGDSVAIENVLNRVFIRPPERLADNVPLYWKKFLREGVKDPPKPEEKPALERPCDPPQGGVYKVCEGTKPPVPTYKPEPKFSEFARKFGLPGGVGLMTIVDSSGSVRDIEIAKPRGAGLDEQAIEAISRWRFQPATRHGKPVSVRIAIDIDFHLD
jgi:TonB family protein